MRRSISGILLGVFVILFGMYALAKGVFGWAFGISGETFWALVIAAVAIVSIVNRGVRFWNVAFLFLGALVFLKQFWFFRHNTFMVLVAIILIAFGIFVIVSATVHSTYGGNNRSRDYDNTNYDSQDYAGQNNTEQDYANQNYDRQNYDGAHYNNQNYGSQDYGRPQNDGDDYINYSAIFSSTNSANHSKVFKGGRASAIFGRMVIDLSNIEIHGNAMIEASAVFGTLVIKLPYNIHYRTNVSTIAGAFEDNARQNPPVQGEPFLQIQGSAVFGTIKII